jgi:hypothetical protein
MAYGEARPAIRHREPGWRQRQHRQSIVLAPADGYAFLLVGTANAISATLYEKLNFNFVRDIVPVAGIARVPEVMLVNPSFSATTVRELIAYGKANPGKLTMASGGIGTLSHVEGELFKISRALTDLLGGQVQVLFGSTSLTIEQIRAGKLRPLAVTTATPWPILANAAIAVSRSLSILAVGVAEAASAAAGAAVSVALRLGIDQRSAPSSLAPILLGFALHRWRCRILALNPVP